MESPLSFYCISSATVQEFWDSRPCSKSSLVQDRLPPRPVCVLFHSWLWRVWINCFHLRRNDRRTCRSRVLGHFPGHRMRRGAGTDARRGARVRRSFPSHGFKHCSQTERECRVHAELYPQEGNRIVLAQRSGFQVLNDRENEPYSNSKKEQRHHAEYQDYSTLGIQYRDNFLNRSDVDDRSSLPDQDDTERNGNRNPDVDPRDSCKSVYHHCSVHPVCFVPAPTLPKAEHDSDVNLAAG